MAAPYFPLSNVDSHYRWSLAAGSTGLSQFQFVAVNSSGQIVTPASGVFCYVLDDAPNITSSGATVADGEWSGGYVVGQYYGIVFGGVIKVQIGASLTPGQPVMTNASGQAIVATGSNNYVLGYSLGAAASGDYAAILYQPSIHP